MVGTVTPVEGQSVLVQGVNVAVEDELDFEEPVSTGTLEARAAPRSRARRLKAPETRCVLRR
jgi:hypothetical protein